MLDAAIARNAAQSVLDGLDPEQRAAAEAVRGPVCILAGAGTGKTRAITHRIAYGVRSGAFAPGHLLAVTFTARAAGELRTRLRVLGAHGVQARTFHAAALRQLTYFAPRVLGGAMPEVLDNPMRLVANAAARLRLRTDRSEVRDLAAEIDWAKSVLATPKDYPARAAAAGREPPRDAGHGRRGLRRVRAGQAARRPARLRRSAADHGRRDRGVRRRRRRGAFALSALRGR